MSDGEMALLTARVNEQRKDRVKERLEHGGLTREIRDLLKRLDEHTGSEKERLKQELQEARETRDEWVQTREEANSHIEQQNKRIERLENELDSIRDKEGEYEGHLQSIETIMHEQGASVWPEHTQIQRAAQVGDCEVHDVIADLQQRNPSLPQSRFEEGQ